MYRDTLAGLKNQIEARRSDLASLELQVSPLLRCLLPLDQQKAIDELYPRVSASGTDMASLADIADALETLIAIFEEALVAASRLRTCPDDVPDPPPPEEEHPWLIEERPLINFRDTVASCLESFAPEARFVRWGDGGYLSRFRLGHTPLAFTTRLIPPGLMDQDLRPLPAARSFVSTLRTSIPEALPVFGVRLESWSHKIGKAIHLSSERELGVQPFDGRFWLTGAEAPTALLTEPVRRALLALAIFAPVLRVGNGVADLTWSAPISQNTGERAISKDAIEVIVGIRSALAGSI